MRASHFRKPESMSLKQTDQNQQRQRLTTPTLETKDITRIKAPSHSHLFEKSDKQSIHA
jgi:hypothetical protein